MYITSATSAVAVRVIQQSLNWRANKTERSLHLIQISTDYWPSVVPIRRQWSASGVKDFVAPMLQNWFTEF
jgi:hypothetical protein